MQAGEPVETAVSSSSLAIANRNANSDGTILRAFGRGVRSNLVGEFGVQALRIGGFVVLARALEPQDFGILRVLIAISLIAITLATLGIPEALIQREDLSEQHQCTAWWISLAAAFAIGLLLYESAPLLAWALAMPSLTYLVRLLALPVLLSGSTAVASARLRRRFQFTAIAASEVAAELAFVSTALLLVSLQRNRWSLPGGLAARITVQAIVVWIAEGYLPRSWPSKAAARDIIGFCATVCGGRLLLVTAANADFVMVGRLLGPSALGFYSMAWDLLRFVSDRLNNVLGRAALPAFCRLQRDNRALSEMYQKFVGYISGLILPLMACAVVAAPRLLAGIYGPRWIPAAVPMRLLSGGLALAGMRTAIGAVYFAKGRPSFDAYVQALRLGLVIVVVSMLARTGLVGVSLGMAMVEASVSIFGQLLVCALIELPLLRIAAPMWPGIKLAGVCVVATLAGEFIAAICNLKGMLSLLVIAIPPAIVFCSLGFAATLTLPSAASCREEQSAPG